MGRIDKIPRPIDVDKNNVQSFDLIKHIKEYKDEYKDRDKRPVIGGLNPEPMMEPYEHEDSIKKLLKDTYETTACYDCPLKLLCDRRNWGFGCEFAKVIGCDKHPDQAKYPGHSTTVALTDTALSGALYSGYQITWAIARDLTSAGSAHDHTTLMWQARRDPTFGYDLTRSGFLVDSSSIPVNASAIEMYFGFWITAIGGTCNGMLTQSSPPTQYPSNPLVDADIDRTKYTAYNHGGWTNSGKSTGAYSVFQSVNHGGFYPNGVTRHFFEEYEHDILNSAPGVSTNYYTIFEGPTHAGGHDPKVTVIYNTMSGGGVSKSRTVNAGGR